MFQNESELHKITEQVNQVYFNLLVLKVNIKLLESVKNTLLERQKSIEAAVHDGILQESDLDYIKIEILKSQQQIDELNISYKSGILELSELTNKNLNDSLVIEIPALEITDMGTFQRAELKGLDAQKTSLDFSDKLYKSQRIPHIYAFSEGGYGRPGLNMLKNDFELFYLIGLSLKWPIWDWNQTSNNRQSLLIQKDMFNSRKLALEKNLRISLYNSQARINQLEKSLISDSNILVLRINITNHSSFKLDQGVIAVPDYINDLDAETQSRIQLQSHKIQLVQEKANYLTIKGTL